MTDAHSQPNTTAGQKIVDGLTEALRAVALVRAVRALDGFEMTEQEAVNVLAQVDAVDPLRQPHPFLDNRKRFSTHE